MGRLRAMAVAAGLAMVAFLLTAAGAEAFTAKTNRGGSCAVQPVSEAAGGGDHRYGLRVPSCDTRNGIKRVVSIGLMVDNREPVDELQRKRGEPAYTNTRTTSEDGNYVRIDYRLVLDRNRGKRAKRKPERWRPSHPDCVRTTTRYSGDTLLCQTFDRSI